jgi:hypothetical protein
MACKLKRRKDDIPKRNKRERSWSCDECGAIIFSEVKPQCRRIVLAQINARHASAEAEAEMLHLDDKGESS